MLAGSVWQMPEAPEPGLKQGDMLDGKYVLRERIARGGMGSVFLAEQPALERTVAIKILRPELVSRPGLARQVRDEAVAASHVRSPHCVAVIDCSTLADGTPYIVMEYVPGRPLGRIIAEQSIPLLRAIDLFEQILSALGATHSCGIVHGDVKSDNFMVELLGGADHVTMIDFGLARVAGAPGCDLGDGMAILGTPEYMAPEVIRGEPPARASDLYGAGVILYELLTGTTPFAGGAAIQIVVRQAHDPVVAPSLRQPDRRIPPAFDRIALRALDKRPEERFPDAASFARELRAAAGEVRIEPPVPGAAPPRRRHVAPSAYGSSLDRVERIRELRCAIGEALARRDTAQIAQGYLELAHLLCRDRRFAAAVCQLEEGIELLTAGPGPAALDRPPVDRLVVALTALYEAGVARQHGSPRRARPAVHEAR